MDTMNILNTDSLRSYNRLHWIIGLILLALLFLLPWTLSIGPNSWRECVPAPKVAAAPAVVPTPAPAPEPTPAPPPPAPDPIPSAKVYFPLDQVNLPADVDATLAEVVAYLKSHENAKALISGFHDPQGKSVTHNQDLALNRARGVRGALEKAGIVRDRLVMNKPQETTGTGSNEEARRVEVAIQQ